MSENYNPNKLRILYWPGTMNLGLGRGPHFFHVAKVNFDSANKIHPLTNHYNQSIN